MRDVIIRPEAELDLLEAFCWYEEQQQGLGFEFNIVVDATLTSVARDPHLSQILYGNVRRSLLRRFPYGIFYVTSDTEVTVVAVFHARRDPKSWPEAAARAEQINREPDTSQESAS
jgi:plasmid stabilization system protein ParE